MKTTSKKTSKTKLNFSLYLFSLIIVVLGLVKGQLKGQLPLILFTRQTVLLIAVYFFIAFFIKKTNKYFSFMTLINTIVTMVLYPIGQKGFFNSTPGFYMVVVVLEHYILPPLFIIYYFLIDKTALKLKQFYLGLIYPFHYFLIIIFFARISHNYPYNDLKKIQDKPGKLLLFVLIITLFIIIISFFSIFLKNKILNKKSVS